MKIKEIIEAKDAWLDLINQKFSIRLSYKLSKYIKLIESELKVIEEEKSKLVKEKYGVKGENEEWSIPQEKIKDFYDELNEFFESDSDVEEFDMSMDDLISELEKNDDNVINIVNIVKLEPFFS